MLYLGGLGAFPNLYGLGTDNIKAIEVRILPLFSGSEADGTARDGGRLYHTSITYSEPFPLYCLQRRRSQLWNRNVLHLVNPPRLTRNLEHISLQPQRLLCHPKSYLDHARRYGGRQENRMFHEFQPRVRGGGVVVCRG